VNYRACTKLCTFERKAGTADDFTGAYPDWEALGSGYCKIEPASGQELTETEQMVAQVTHRITTRWQPLGLSPKDRIVYGSRVFNLISVVDVGEDGKWIEAMAVEHGL
jgi:SPP1 family predicted phage head-tail adaptor